MSIHAVQTVPGRRSRLMARWIAAGCMAAVTPLILAAPTALPAAAATHDRAVVTFRRTTSPLGAVLVTAKGRTLYVDIHDRADHVACTAGCARSWPPLLLAKGVTKPVGGPGVQGLGTVRRPGHRLQVTWHKRPLYLFTGDVRPGQTHGQGVGAAFFVVTPGGVFRSVPPTAGTPTGATGPAGAPGAPPAPTTPQTTTPSSGASSRAATSPPATSPAATSPPATSPPATSPAATSPPATSPPPTSPPPTSPPPTSPPATSPPTTAPAGGGVAY
jgi:predicted lipoprotein with Yx(FWY)xxD motif